MKSRKLEIEGMKDATMGVSQEEERQGKSDRSLMEEILGKREAVTSVTT